MRPGLCSVTYRQLDPAGLIALAADAGLEVIEWGGDVHVPHGDTVCAAEVGRMTTDAGLATCSYGSYFRSGASESLTPVLDSASALGTDRARIWAGEVASSDATPQQYAEVVTRLQDAVEEASGRDISLALEYHRGTLADTPAATLRLLADVPGLTTYWQPSVGADDEGALAEYDAVAGRTSAIHVFSWWPQTERLRLRERDGLWRSVFAQTSGSASDALIEFVPDDEPDLLAAEAATLRAWLPGVA